MTIIAMSSSQQVENEVEEVVKMFELGLEHFHVRKPKLSKRALAEYLKSFPEVYRKHLIIHSYHDLADQLKLGGIHLSRRHRRRRMLYSIQLWWKRKTNPGMIVSRTFHKLTDLNSDTRVYTYGFLSPIFDSVSQNSLGGGYSKRALLIMIPQALQPIYALGGIQADNIEKAAELGFQGAVLLGSLWRSDEKPHEVYRQASAKAHAIS